MSGNDYYRDAFGEVNKLISLDCVAFRRAMEAVD